MFTYLHTIYIKLLTTYKIMMNLSSLNWFDSFIKKLKKALDCINHVIYTPDSMEHMWYYTPSRGIICVNVTVHNTTTWPYIVSHVPSSFVLSSHNDCVRVHFILYLSFITMYIHSKCSHASQNLKSSSSTAGPLDTVEE